MLTIAVLSIAIALITMSPAFAKPPTSNPANYEVVFVGVTYDVPANTSTWTYNITCKASPGISHVDFQFKDVCDPPLSSIIAAGPVEWEIITEPPKDYNGTRFEFDPSIEEGETVTIWFTLEGLWDVNDITVYVKAATCTFSYLPPGPSCFVVPEVPLGPIAAAFAAFVAMGFYARRKQRIP